MNTDHSLTRTQLDHLACIDESPLTTLTHTGRASVPVLESLVDLGLASAHRSSIGEVDEKATYSITEAGVAVLRSGASA